MYCKPLPHAISTALVITASASSLADENFFDLPLNDLTNIQVTVASASAETIRETPAIVSRLDRVQMERMGLRTLKEILSMLPSVVVNKSTYGNSPISIRGLTDSFNQKILFLLDDTPYWMPAHADIPLLGIPVSAIERVEVIRGPGAVIYGTNASAGVIKIITRKDSSSDITAYAGKNDLFNASLHHQLPLAGGDLSISAEWQHDNGFDAEANNFFRTENLNFIDFDSNYSDKGEINRAQEKQSLLLNYRKKGLELTAHAFESSYAGAVTSTLLNTSETEETGYLLGGKYTFERNGWKYKTFADANRYYHEIPTDELVTANSIVRLGNDSIQGDGRFVFEDNGGQNHRVRAGINSLGDIATNLTLLSGIEYEHRHTEDYNIKDNVGGAHFIALGEPSGKVLQFEGDRIEEYSAYGQLDYKIDDWRLVVGARYTDNEDYGEEITPRASLVYQLSQQQSLKLLYSVGFNSPTFAQKQVISNTGEILEPDLDAEIITSTDLAYTYSSESQHLVVTLFYLEAEDLIVRSNVTGFTNQDNIVRRYGAEINYEVNFDRIKTIASAGYLDQGNEKIENDESAFYAPSITASLGAYYTLNNQQLGLSWRHLGKRGDVDAYDLVNLSYTLQQNNITWFADLRNALDETAIHPHVRSPSITGPRPEIQAEDNVNVIMGLRYQFGQ